MFVFGKISRDRLMHVHPDLVLLVSRALLYTEVDFAVRCGLRTYGEQIKLRDANKSKTLNSKHLKQGDGYSHAVDLVAVGDLDGDGDIDIMDGKRRWEKQWYVKISGAMERAAVELGIAIRWGGDWDCDGDWEETSFFDGPHFELR